jgi:hypothetical protein
MNLKISVAVLVRMNFYFMMRKDGLTVGKIIDLTLEMKDGLQTFFSHPRMVVLNRVTYEFSGPKYIDLCKGLRLTALKQLADYYADLDGREHYLMVLLFGS